MLNKKKNNKGFTLVELLVVIAIIGILAVVAVPALFKNIEKGKVADLTADINAIRSASLAFYADENTYPEAGNIVGADANLNSIFDGNLENISNPFDSTSYTLAGTTGQDLTLAITLPNISQDAIDRLTDSLGSLVVGEVLTNSITVTLLNAQAE